MSVWRDPSGALRWPTISRYMNYMARKSRPTPSSSVAKPTIYEDFFHNGKAHCNHCKAEGKVEKSTESGVSRRVIVWKHKDGSLSTESWTHFSAPNVCRDCWVSERTAAGKLTYEE